MSSMEIPNKVLVKALGAIQDITLKIMNDPSLKPEASYAISLIESICRHGHDVRSPAEREKYSPGTKDEDDDETD